jgi:superfamily II DNA or RNA helicase
MNQRNKIQEEALTKTIRQHRSGLGISMGVGKTLIGLKHMNAHYNGINRFLVVAPKVSIFQSWKDDAVKFKMEYLLDSIDFSTYLSINKQDPSLYTVVYLDECHSLLYNHRQFLDAYDGKILGLTGTPPVREFTEKAQMVKQFCPIVYKYKIDEAVEDKILNSYTIKVHYLKLSKKNDLLVKYAKGSFYTSEEKSYAYAVQRIAAAEKGTKSHQFAIINRMRAIKEFKTKEEYATKLIKGIDNKCIVFANTQAQADRICIHSYHSKNPESEENLQAFKDDHIKRLSCVEQLNEGVTIPNLKEGVIMHSYGNERKSAQRLGRLLRLNPEDHATIHILCYKDTIDETWVASALKGIDQSNIETINAYSYYQNV